jgi:hypothetical protein
MKSKKEVFDIVNQALVNAGFEVAGGGDMMTVFREPYTKLFFNIYGDLVVRKLEHWEEVFANENKEKETSDSDSLGIQPQEPGQGI